MNEWVNLYPEGQVNKKNEWMRFYWGVGRMLYEAPKTKLLPFYHIGLNELYAGCPKKIKVIFIYVVYYICFFIEGYDKL